MNRRTDMLKNNDSKSGEKTINYKKGKGYELQNDAISMEESREDDSEDALGSCAEIQPVNEKSSTKENSPGIRVFRCPTIVKNSKVPIHSNATSVLDAKRINEGEQVETLKCPTAKDASAYKMNLLRRGKCVIFNHENFEKGNGVPRPGTKFDVEAIEKTFKALGFEIILYNDLLWYEINEEIEELAKENYEDYACICIFILTHGTSEGRLSARDASYSFVTIWTSFTADKCPTLFGKPKIFFIQACRGKYYEKAIRGRSETDYDEQSYTLPSQADFLFGYSTMEGFYSLRQPQEGTWYIQTLCNMINQYWKDYDLLKILTMTARKIGIEKSYQEQSSDEKKQMPVVTTTLTRDIYFAPPPQ